MTKPTLYLGNRLDMPSFHFLILFVSAPHLLLLLRNAPPELSGRCCLIANQTIVPRCHNFWDSEQQSSLWFTADKAVWGKKSRCVFNPWYCTIPLFDFFCIMHENNLQTKSSDRFFFGCNCQLPNILCH